MKIALKHIPMLLGLWCLAVLTIVSCDPSDEVKPNPPTIELGSSTVEAAGGPQFLHVKSDISWTLSIVSEYGETLDWISVDRTTGAGDCNVVMKVSPNSSDEGRTATIVVTSEAGEDSVVLTQKGKASSSNPSGGNLSPKTGWLELPAVPEGTDAFTHSMTLNSKKTRNYSFIWDYDNLVAPWIAYPLCRGNMGSSSRSDAWALDPLLDESQQPVLHFHGFSVGNSGKYDRGHQVPSADRPNTGSGTDNPNAMTFYGTNMTPQLNGFNGGIWRNLEGLVRSWANSSDTLYVVTGCVVDYPEGETVKYALDNAGKKVTVPTGYYKVVLRYSASSTFGYSGYSACAILFEHKVYGNKNVTSEYSMSVDDLEKKLGIDFFVNLPAKVGEETAAKIEAENPAKVSWWWR